MSASPASDGAKPGLLFLSHRIPYPPNKGDKVRSFHLLTQLSTHYRVHLGAFVDQAEDWGQAGELDRWCASRFLLPLRPALQRALSLRGLLSGEALTLPYYRARAMEQWVADTVEGHGLSRAFVFSSSMAQYVSRLGRLRRVVDYCDVDSAKWAEYARRKSGPVGWIYRREGQRLLDFERASARQCDHVTLVAEHERDLFLRLAPELGSRVEVLRNGVDAEYFAPDPERPDPYEGGVAVVFTGAMDYWPNVDAVTWFVRDIWPAVRARHPAARFAIVGMNPTPAVRALEREPGVLVTGSVPDVRPWLQHARLAVAPLRIARGIQNKVLEAMAMDKLVVAHTQCVTPLRGALGQGLVEADEAVTFAEAVSRVLSGDRALTAGLARAYVQAHFSWQASGDRLVQLLEDTQSSAPGVA